MKPTLVLLHGWGFDAGLWDGVAAELAEFCVVRLERGYFGATPMKAWPAAPVVAVGHSLGAMVLARRWPDAPLVAINGFDRFCGDDAIPARVLARMRQRFTMAPEGVLADFRARLGAGVASAITDPVRLGEDLARLADEAPPPARTVPVLVLNGENDPLLPPAMRAATFAGAPRESLDTGGHLLPLTAPAWCAAHIRRFAA